MKINSLSSSNSPPICQGFIATKFSETSYRPRSEKLQCSEQKPKYEIKTRYNPNLATKSIISLCFSESLQSLAGVELTLNSKKILCSVAIFLFCYVTNITSQFQFLKNNG